MGEELDRKDDGGVVDRMVARPWNEVLLPWEVRAVPTMLSEAEQRLLFWLARDYAGDGAIIDAGAFLGGSSAALLAGIRDRKRPRTGPPMTSYDMFRVERYTLETYFADTELQVGDSFRPHFDANLAAFAEIPHRVVEHDITQERWTEGPIDVLFLDVMKSPEVTGALQQNFFPSLVPGRSVIVHQDYAYGALYWIHISVELMWKQLRFVAAEPHCTHVFLVLAPIPPEVLATTVLDLPAERAIELMDRAIGRWDGRTRGMLQLSKAAMVADYGYERDARRQLAAVRSAYGSDEPVMACADITEHDLDAHREATLRMQAQRGRSVEATRRTG